MTVLTSIGFGLAAAVVIAGGILLNRKWQKTSEGRRQEQLRKIARNRRLSILEGEVPRHLVERARDLDEAGRYRVCDAMVGRDESGTYYFARRVTRGRSVQMLLFDANKDTRIDGFSLAPRRRSNFGSLWRRWAGGLFGQKPKEPVSIELGWKCRPAELLQEGLLERATQTMRAVAEACYRSSSTALGIHVDGKRIAVFAERGLETKELDRFMKHALDLRYSALSVLLDLRHLGSGSTAIRPISEAITQVASRTSQRTSEAISRSLAGRDPRQSSGAWSMPMDVPPGNERYDEEVVIYTSRGIPLDA